MTNTLPPFAWTAFETNPPAPSRRDWIEIVNRSVNGGIIPEYGAAPPFDVWRLWPRTGWCHDYAITKRFELMLRGFAASDLSLVECIAPDGEHHLVLIADGLVMDNLNPTVRPAAKLGYTIVRQQSAGNPDVWTA